MSIVDEIIETAEKDLGLDKMANDKNGAPQNATNTTESQDIFSLANSFLQEIEQFKQQLTGAVANNPTQQVDAQNAPNPENTQTADANMAGPPTNAPSSGIEVQRPDGTVVKIASLLKLASLKGSKLFKEVK